MEKKSIFRKESLDRIESPEQLDEYIHVSRPGVWIILAAMALSFISILVWSIVGTLPETMLMQGVTRTQNKIVCYENVNLAKKDLVGCKARITLPDGTRVNGVVQSVSKNPYSKEEIRKMMNLDWLFENVVTGNYAYEVMIQAEDSFEENLLATVVITTDEVKPIQYILN